MLSEVKLSAERNLIDQQKESHEPIQDDVINEFIQESISKEKTDRQRKWMVASLFGLFGAIVSFWFWAESDKEKQAKTNLSLGEKVLIETHHLKRYGVELFREKKYDKAIKQFNKSLEIMGDDPEVTIYLSNADVASKKLVKEPPDNSSESSFAIS